MISLIEDGGINAANVDVTLPYCIVEVLQPSGGIGETLEPIEFPALLRLHPVIRLLTSSSFIVLQDQRNAIKAGVGFTKTL